MSIKTTNIKKLNLGCGTKIMKGYINLDKINLNGVDVIHDINNIPLPFPDNYFNEVTARNILEHTKDLIATMREIHRILKPKGKLIFRIPMGFTYTSANVDHRWNLYPQSMLYFTRKRSGLCKFLSIEDQNNLLDFEFDITKMKITLPIIHLKFPWYFCFLNSFINGIFSGIEGVMIKK